MQREERARRESAPRSQPAPQPQRASATNGGGGGRGTTYGQGAGSSRADQSSSYGWRKQSYTHAEYDLGSDAEEGEYYGV
jgi:hypothetical protein